MNPTVSRIYRSHPQAGAALITAMLLAALITILAASWLARFDSQLRIVEMGRTGTQARWLMRAGTDYARIVALGEQKNLYDDLTQPWAIPLAPLRISDAAGMQEAYFSGRLQDAQARFNLYNVFVEHQTQVEQARQTASGTTPQPAPSPLDPNTPNPATNPATLPTMAWANALMHNSGLTPAQASAWLAAIFKYNEPAITASNGVAPTFSQTQILDTLPAGMVLSDTVKSTLEARFTWLHNETNGKTSININTVDVAVLGAHPAIGEAKAKALLNKRKTATVRSVADIANTLGFTQMGINEAVAQHFDVRSSYFIATGRLTMGRADLMTQSLIYRASQAASPNRHTYIAWTKPL